MNRIMAFLESCGADASLAHADRDTLAHAARAAGLEDNEVQALLNLDQSQLGSLSCARTRMTCAVFAAKLVPVVFAANPVPCVFAAHGVSDQEAA
ncbi:MAG: hypothetical protein KDI71_06180 [Xanthomonadales bacterium]|nr:hypothetical protein [Xanthomonadales bacterium]